MGEKEIREAEVEKCAGCGIELPAAGLTHYAGKQVCSACLVERSLEGNICPNCGLRMDATEHQVAFSLEQEGVFAEANRHITALAIVCSRCRSLFLDEFMFKILLKS